MNDQDRRANEADPPSENTAPSGPNLKLIYSLIALAIVLAMALAGLIVLPFYVRR